MKRLNKKRMIAICVLFGTMMVVFAGCGGGGSSVTAAPPTTTGQAQVAAYSCRIASDVSIGAVSDVVGETVDQIVSVPVYLTGTETLYATATVVFDPSKITPVTTGDFATSSDSTINVIGNPGNGKIMFYDLDYIANTATPTSGIVMVLKFQVVTPGESKVSLRDVVVQGRTSLMKSTCDVGGPNKSVISMTTDNKEKGGAT
jgi:hypothetical protein